MAIRILEQRYKALVQDMYSKRGVLMNDEIIERKTCVTECVKDKLRQGKRIQERYSAIISVKGHVQTTGINVSNRGVQVKEM